MSKRRYLAIKYTAGAHHDIVMGPTFGHHVHAKFYHWHGPTWMPWPDDAEIVKDYGTIDLDDNEALKDVEVQYARDFPWENGIQAGGGWLAPDGTFYPCRSWEHNSAISFLKLQVYGHEFPPGDGYGTIDRMEKLGWLKLYDDLVIVPRRRLTQRQIDALGDLLMVEGQSEDMKRSLRDTIERSER